jgi:hypothetical protein
MKMSVPDVELVIGKDGTGLDSGLDPYTFMQAAQFCGVAPGDPPFGQKNGQMVDQGMLGWIDWLINAAEDAGRAERAAHVHA